MNIRPALQPRGQRPNTLHPTAISKAIAQLGQQWRAGSRLVPSWGMAAVLLAPGLTGLAQANTLPTGGMVSAGAATISSSAAQMNVMQSSQRAVIDWSSFSIGQGAKVVFTVPNAQGATLNRVNGSMNSVIAGQLTSNGTLYLINTNGIAITSTGAVNTGGGFVASSLDLTDADFMAGRLLFNGRGASAQVSNAGSINAGQGAYVALLGGAVSNSGVITVPMGRLGLGSGEQVTLDLNGNNFMQVAVPSNWLADNGALVDNSGTLQASGGVVQLKAAVLRQAVREVINMSGTINADSATGDGGRIELIGGTDAQNMAGTVRVSGRLSAQATGPSGNGGFIDTSGAHLELGGISVSTQSLAGSAGTWLIDPYDITISSGTGSGTSFTGTTTALTAAATTVINTTTLQTALAANNVVIKTGTAGGAAGDITIASPLTWGAHTLTLDAARDINIKAVVSVTGTGGFVGITGDTAQTGTGNLLNGDLTFGLGPTGFAGRLDLASTASFGLNGGTYTIITSLGAAGSTTGTDLQGITGNLSRNYVLGANIDASSTAAWNSGAGFNPIGKVGNGYYAGVFNGLGHAISGLTINLPSDYNVGLFSGVAVGSRVHNLGLVGGSVTGLSAVGAMVGESGGELRNVFASTTIMAGSDGVVGGLVGRTAAPIKNAYATGSVTTTGSDVGGLVGQLSDSGAIYGTLENVYATGAVSGVNNIGGLVGSSVLSGRIVNAITNAYASGNVTATGAYVGGLVGRNSTQISRVYATGNVSSMGTGFGGSNIGGLVGGLNGLGATLVNAYATGAVSGNGDNVGGLVGSNNGGTISNSYSTGRVTSVAGAFGVGGLVGNNSGVVTNSVWDTTTSGQNSSAGGTGLSTAQLAAALPTGFNASVWANSNNQSTPFLTGFDWAASSGRVILAGDTSATPTYYTLLGNIQAVQAINANATSLAGRYGLSTQIDASDTAGWNSGAGFAPIGTQASPFSGVFNGFGHAISGLTINRPSTEYVGLFGAASSGSSISNMGLLGGSIAGYSVVGALAGASSGGITNSYATTTVSGGYTHIGGLVGLNNSGGTITASYASGAVTGVYRAGGLVGHNNGRISSSFASGNITATAKYAGGLVGSNEGGMISDTYATGVVQATTAAGVPQSGTFAGGLVGSNFSSGTISNSYSTGSVSATANAGGLVGENVSNAVVTNSYWNTTTSGQNASAGGTGLTSTTIKQASSFSGWSIDSSGGQATTWRIYGGSTAPLLKAFLTPLAIDLGAAQTVTYNGQLQYFSLPAGASGANILGATNGGTNVGTYAISASGLYSNQLGYDITTAGSGGTLTITPAPLTLTGTRAYDGSTSVAGTVLTATGINGQTFTVTGAGAAGNLGTANASATPQTLASVSGLGIGTSSNGGSAANYTLSTIGSTVTITAAPITVTANAQSVTYGTTIPTLGYSISRQGGGTGLFGADALSGALSTAAGAASVVGTYAITQGTLSGGGNYALTYVGANLAITPASLTITGATRSAAYTGAAQTNTYTVSGLVGSDAVSTVQGRASGTNATATAYTDSLSGATGTGLGNYTINYVNGALTITPAPLTLTGTRAYDGSTTVAGTVLTATGINGQSFTVTGAGAAGNLGTANASATPQTLASVTGLSLGTGSMGALASNYTLSTIGSTVTITAAPITVTANANQSVIYGTSLASLGYSVSRPGGGSGLFGADALSGALSTAVAAPNVGTHAITQGTLSGGGNYVVTYVGANVTITPASLTLVGSRTYDGTTAVAGSALTAIGVNGQTFTVTGSGAAGNLGSANASATPKVLASLSGLTLSTSSNGGLASNYNALSVSGSMVTITAAPLNLTYSANAVHGIYGSVPAGLGGTVTGTGFVNGEGVGNLIGSVRWSTDATPGSSVGHYAITGSGLTSNNYSITSAQAAGNDMAYTVDGFSSSLSSALPWLQGKSFNQTTGAEQSPLPWFLRAPRQNTWPNATDLIKKLRQNGSVQWGPVALNQP